MVVKTKTSPTLHVYNRNIYYPVWQSESITEKVEINEGFFVLLLTPRFPTCRINISS